MLRQILWFIFTSSVSSYKLCILGAGGGLGRELVYQSINNFNSTVLGLTSKVNRIYKPFRGDGFIDKKEMPIFNHPSLTTLNYWENIQDDFEHLILCTSGRPFENDYSDKLTDKIFNTLPERCLSVNLVSAWGVGDSISESNWGIQIMNSWYLQDTYRAKNKQEEMLASLPEYIQTRIYRPKALSFGDTYLESTTRQELASQILEDIFILDKPHFPN